MPLILPTMVMSPWCRSQNGAYVTKQSFHIDLCQLGVHRCNENISDVIIGAMASQIISLTIVYSAVHSDPDQRKHQSSASLAFVRGIHRRPVNSPRKWPVTRKIFPFDDVIMGRKISFICILSGFTVISLVLCVVGQHVVLCAVKVIGRNNDLVYVMINKIRHDPFWY